MIPKVLTCFLAFVAIFYFQTEKFERNNDWTYCILKTLPCLSLSGLVYLEHTNLTGDHAFMQTLGLIFGALGDFLLSLWDGGLTVGAISFAFGHFFYMANFVPKIKNVSKQFAAIILVYAAMMNHFFLMPQLSAAPISTLIFMLYSLILCTAVVLSASVYFNGTIDKSPKQFNDLLRLIGYGLFFFSDSLLLLCDIGAKVPYHHFLVLSTYFTAQYLILTGATNQLV